MPQLTPKHVPPDQLLLDPNNLRFQDSSGFLRAEEDRFAEPGVQASAYRRLKESEGLVDLKRSIMRNGYTPVEQIVVRPYPPNPQKYIVIEGNRRTAAVRWILDDYGAGVGVAPEVLLSLQELPTVVAEQSGADEAFRASLMGIRHVSGIKQWGGYQRASLIVMMRDELGLEASNVADRLGLSTHEVNRRYRAFKALRQLEGDEEFGEFAKATMYPLFHEAVSLPVVREWLEWKEETAAFEGDDLHVFYELITPSQDDEGNRMEPKLVGFAQVRELRKILPKPEARRILLDAHRSLQEAITIAHQDELARSWMSDVSTAVTALERMGINELKKLSQDDQAILEKLRALADERLRDRALLAGGASAE
ncbi:MAG: hypothetical protein OXU74_06415 [Gemmatimonadota bacterium]|nr:hypothetical protein [Gemmatimonadota bacterium]